MRHLVLVKSRLTRRALRHESGCPVCSRQSVQFDQYPHTEWKWRNGLILLTAMWTPAVGAAICSRSTKSHSVQCIRGVRSEQAARPSGVQGFVRTVYRRLERGAMRTTIPIKARSECSLIGIFVHLSCVLGLQLYAHSNRLSVLKVDVSMRHWQGLYLLGDEIISTQRLQAANPPSH